MAVAADARVRGLPLRVAVDERLDDPGAELVTQVDREVRELHRVGERAGLRDRGRRAAAAFGVVLTVGPQLQRDRGRRAGRRDTGARRRRCRRRRSSPPASVPGRRVAPAPRRGPSPPVRAPGRARRRPIRRRAACRGSSRRARRRSRTVPIRAASRIGAPRTSVTAALPAAWAEPQPSASKPASVTVSPSIWTLNVISSQQEPPPLVTVKASSGVCRLPCGEVRWCSKAKGSIVALSLRRGEWEESQTMFDFLPRARGVEAQSSIGGLSLQPHRRPGSAAQPQAQLAQLHVVDRRRRTGQRVAATGRLRERDHLTDVVAPGQQRHDPIDAERDPAVRRRAVTQRVEQEPEPRLGVLLDRSRSARTPSAGRRSGGYGSTRRRSRCRRARGHRSATAASPGRPCRPRSPARRRPSRGR